MNTIKILEELISIKSFNTQENKEIINYLINKLKPYCQEIIKIKNKNNNRENLLIGINTKLKNVENAIILSGHIDTVVADEKLYKTNPYKPTIIDNKMYGLGAIDMKSFFACILNNIETLQSINKPIILSITGDEETYLEGIKNISEKLNELNIIPKVSIIGEPTCMNICLTSKSCYEYQIEIFGKSCHSSSPQNGINANYIAARIMLFIEKINLKYKNTSLSSNIINGGEKVNIISSYAKLHFDIRSLNLSSVNKVNQQIENFVNKLLKKYKGCKIKLEKVLEIPALEKNKSKLIKSIVNKFNLTEMEFKGGCEAGYLQKVGGDAFIFCAGDLNLAHKPNEYVEIAELEKYNDKLMQIIKFI